MDKERLNRKEEGSGSGFRIRENDNNVTCCHCLTDHCSRMSIEQQLHALIRGPQYALPQAEKDAM